MSNKNSSTETERRVNLGDEVMTREKFVPLFDDIKQLIVSTAKGTETVLRGEMRREVGSVRKELRHTQQALKATKDELRTEIKGSETRLRAEVKDAESRLSDKIDSVHVILEDHETRISTLEIPHS